MNKFNVDDEVYLASFFGKKVSAEKIRGIDVIDGIQKYWLANHFGYFDGTYLFKTKAEALDRLYRWNNEK